MAGVRVEREIDAPREVVFDVVTDHTRYPRFTPIRRAVLEHEGSGEPNGVGAVRALHLVGPPIRERVIRFERPVQFSYELISRHPVRELIGTVLLEEAAGGRTALRYEIGFEPLVPVPGAGTAMERAIEAVVSQLLGSVEEEAQRRAAGGG